MMMETVKCVLLLALFSVPCTKGTRFNPPDKPKLTSCRSPEKETFTCWWQPGYDGGLPTTYALYYLKDNSDTIYECPDYHTAGENSCFFNKNDTSVWVNYNITVVATNALGSNFSDPEDVDVAYIVQPHTPENVTVNVMEDKGWPFLRVSWESPHKADIRSGWITLIYELRVKLEGEDEWEEHHAGQQKMFNIFSIRSGSTYLVQVRCKPDHGFWSEWSSTTYVKVPEYFFRERSLWILVTVFSSFTLIILLWILHMNSHSLKHCLLPPVPGPKIKGFDQQIFKNGRSDDILSALMVPNFPPTKSSNYEDLLVEYLEVYVSEEQELILEENKDSCLKSDSSTCDSDSGRGSCDSHTLLTDKCGEAKGERRASGEDSGVMMESQKGWEEEALSYAHEEVATPDVSSRRVKTWPSVFSSVSQYTTSPLDQKTSLELSKQHCLSDTLFPPGSSTKEVLGPNYWEFDLSNKQSHLLQPQTQGSQQLQAHSDVNISYAGRKQVPGLLQLPGFKSTEYVEVQKVNQEDMVILQPVASENCGRDEECAHVLQGEDYSKVKGVGSDNTLFLQSGVKARMGDELGRYTCEEMETNGGSESCYTPSSSAMTQKHKDSIPVQEEPTRATNGYVDTTTMFSLPMY